MATKKTTAGKSMGAPTGLLHKSFQPGKDGHAYLYYWVKYMDKAAPPKAGAPAARVLQADTGVIIVDSDGSHEEAFKPFSFDIKSPKGARSPGQFGIRWLPPGTTRKGADAWINSKEGKAWAGTHPIAMGSVAMRMF